MFFVNLPIGIVALIAAAILLPAGKLGTTSKPGYDLVGLALLTAGLVAILVPLIEGQDKGWPAWTFITLAAGVLLIVAFGAVGAPHQGRQPDGPAAPVQPPRSSRAARSWRWSTSPRSPASSSRISLLWQAGLGHTALQSGVVGVPFALGSIVGASQSNRLAQRLGPHGPRARARPSSRVGLAWVWLVLRNEAPPT